MAYKVFPEPCENKRQYICQNNIHHPDITDIQRNYHIILTNHTATISLCWQTISWDLGLLKLTSHGTLPPSEAYPSLSAVVSAVRQTSEIIDIKFASPTLAMQSQWRISRIFRGITHGYDCSYEYIKHVSGISSLVSLILIFMWFFERRFVVKTGCSQAIKRGFVRCSW